MLRPSPTDGLLAATVLAIIAAVASGAAHGFDPAWVAAGACDARNVPDGLLACFGSATWRHLSITHAALNIVAIAVLWRHLRTGAVAEVATAGVAGSLLGLTLASLLWGQPVAGASALVHGWLGWCFVRSRTPLQGFDLFAVAGLLALGASAPTWVGHLVATSAGAGATMLLATERAPR